MIRDRIQITRVNGMHLAGRRGIARRVAARCLWASIGVIATLVNCAPAYAILRRIEARSIIPASVSRPLTEPERQYLAGHSLVQPNDPAMRTFLQSHHMRPNGPGRRPAPGPAPAPAGAAPTGASSGTGPDMNYYHGQVLVNPVVVPVFWGFGAVNGMPSSALDPNGVVPYLMGFLDHLAGSPWLAIVDQYYQDPGSQRQFIQSSSLTIANPIFDDSSAPAQLYGNTDVFNEVQRLVGAGRIIENSSEIIVVVTPHNTFNADLADNGDCAAHYSFQSMNWFQVTHHYTYVSAPYMPDSGGTCGAGTVSGVLDGVSIVVGHEIAEAITDPYSNYDWNIDHEAGWVTPQQPGQEIGDLCEWLNMQNSIFAPGVAFPTQPLWSNQAQGCVQPPGLPRQIVFPPQRIPKPGIRPN